MTEDGHEYPDGLTPAERRVLDYVRAGTLDAEIAVRLGVPVGDVKERVASIVRKTGVGSRAALVDWHAPAEEPGPASGSVAVPGQDEAVAAATAAEQAAAPRVSRRKFIGGLAGLGALAAGGTAAALLVRREESTRPAATPSQTAAASAPPLLFEPVADAFERRTFAPGEPIDWQHGLFTMDLETGEVHGSRLSSRFGSAMAFGYRLTGGIVTCESADGASGWALYSGSNVSYRWDARQMRLVSTHSGGGTNAFLFERPRAGAFEPGSYVLVRGALGDPLVEFPTEPSQLVPPPVISPDATSVAFWSWPAGHAPAVRLRNIDSGEEWSIEVPADLVGNPAELRPVSIATVPGTVHLFEATAIRGLGAAQAVVVRANWRGERLGAFVTGLGTPPATAPGGATHASEAWLMQSNPSGDFFLAQWPAVDVWGADGTRLFRVRSASLLYGDALEGSRWLADGRGFVALVDSRDEAATLDGRLAYAVVSADGDEVERLAIPPPPGGRWWEHTIYRGPVPSPFDPDWFALGRLEAWNPRTGRHLIANLAGESGPAHYGPWTGEGNGFVFALPHGGHDGAAPPILLDAIIERQPQDTFPVQVRAGDCLNLRDAPGPTGVVAVCLAPATQLELVSDDGAPTAAAIDGVTWVRVRAGDREGWVSSAYLEWA